MMSLKNKIKLHLKSQYPKFLFGYEVGEFARSQGSSHSTGERRARELAVEGFLVRQEKDGLVQFSYNPEPYELKEIEILQTGQQILI